MARRTNTDRAREVAGELARHVPWSVTLVSTCARLTTAATLYARIQERWTSEQMTGSVQDRVRRDEAGLETLLGSVVGLLPDHRGGPWAVQFSGDPRGYTVRLLAPDGTFIGLDRE